jgi:hypothetical protein
MFARNLGCAALAVSLAAPLLGGPALTTIQDVIYRADGTPYNGLVAITWTAFEAGDTSKIATQYVTATITNGNLMVQLVPSTNANPAGYYSVLYTSSGNDQFTETWAVPPSTHPLRVRDVLLSPSALLNGTPPIEETDVVGLTADLGARPAKGMNYNTGRTAYIDASGALEAVNGSLSDCVHVDGSSGPCGTGSGGTTSVTFADAEALAGVVDGSNTAFSISGVPSPSSSLAVFRNGLLQKAGQDYTATGAAIQFLAGSTPQPGDTLLASYRVTPAGTTQGPPSPQVLCSGTGSATSSTTLTTLGTCAIAPGTLQPGDRVKISFDYSHEGTLTGFTFTVNWGNTLLVQRSASAGDALISGWAEAGAGPAACQVSVQSWGTVLGFSAGVLNAWDSLAYPILLAFQGNLAAVTTDTVTLRNFTVVRYPKAP